MKGKNDGEQNIMRDSDVDSIMMEYGVSRLSMVYKIPLSISVEPYADCSSLRSVPSQLIIFFSLSPYYCC